MFDDLFFGGFGFPLSDSFEDFIVVLPEHINFFRTRHGLGESEKGPKIAFQGFHHMDRDDIVGGFGK